MQLLFNTIYIWKSLLFSLLSSILFEHVSVLILHIAFSLNRLCLFWSYTMHSRWTCCVCFDFMQHILFEHVSVLILHTAFSLNMLCLLWSYTMHSLWTCCVCFDLTQCIQEATFAHVGFSNDRHAHSIPQSLSLTIVWQMTLQLLTHFLNFSSRWRRRKNILTEGLLFDTERDHFWSFFPSLFVTPSPPLFCCFCGYCAFRLWRTNTVRLCGKELMMQSDINSWCSPTLTHDAVRH